MNLTNIKPIHINKKIPLSLTFRNENEKFNKSILDFSMITNKFNNINKSCIKNEYVFNKIMESKNKINFLSDNNIVSNNNIKTRNFFNKQNFMNLYSSHSQKIFKNIGNVNNKSSLVKKPIKTENINFMYKRIFSSLMRSKKLKENNNKIDNTCNLLYSDSQNEFYEKLKKLKSNKKNIRSNLKVNLNSSPYINKKINDLNEKLKFMKDVTNYTFPKFLLKQITYKNQKSNNYFKKFETPSEYRYRKLKEINKLHSSALSSSLSILKL